MSGDPSLRLLSIDLLDDDEHNTLDVWGNRAALTQSAGVPASIPELFSAQVDRAPAATALTCGERSWTYLELDRAANRLAHLLVGHGAGARASVSRCCSTVPPRRSSRSWPCSNPGRHTCRSIRRIPTRG